MLQVFEVELDTTAIVDSLARHVLCSLGRLFGADGLDRNYIHINIHTHMYLDVTGRLG